MEHGPARLVSRNGNTFKSFAGLCSSIGECLAEHDAILDGEIVCLGPDGRALFEKLLYRRAEPHFYAFDSLFLDGRDLRGLPLIQRKAILRGLVPRQPCRLLYVDHLAGYGVDLFEAVCAADLEGIVAKIATAPYGTEPPSWVKIKNRYYGQAAGRRERFERIGRAGTP